MTGPSRSNKVQTIGRSSRKSGLDDARAEQHTNFLSSRGNNGFRSPSTIRSNTGTNGSNEQRKVSDRSQYISSSNSGPPRVLVRAAADSDRAAYRGAKTSRFIHREPFKVLGL